MSVRKITLAKEGSDEVEYLYPKTTADIVEYIDDQSVKDKLDSLDEVEREVRTARKASHDNIIKSNLSERIHEDYEDLKNRIDNITQTDINLFDGILSIEKGGTGASTIYDALFNLSYRTASGAVDLDNLKNKEHLGIWTFDMSNHLTNSPSEATGYLIVIKQSEMTCKQIWLNQGSDKYHEIYTRVYNGSEWKDWVKISNEIDLEELKTEINNTKITINRLDDDFVLPINKGGTGAVSATQAFYNLSTHIVRVANLDLNDFIGRNLNLTNSVGDEYIGCYYFGSNYLPAHSPSSTVGYLIVLHGGGAMRKQIWLNQGSDKYHEIYTRVYNGSEWKDWVKISNEIDLEELKDYTDTKITDLRKVALVGSDAENQTGWHLVAEGILSGYSNASIMFAVHDTKSYNSGILALDVRCTNNEIVYKNIGWLTRSGFSLEDFAIQTYSNNSWKLFYKVNQRYYRVVFEVIEYSATASKDLDYTLYSNQTVYANTGTPQSSKDLYIPYGRKNNTTVGAYSIALGSNNTSSGAYSTAIGYNNTTSNSGNSIGYSNTSSGSFASALGYSNTSSGNYSTTIGYNNTSSGNYSTSVGHTNSINSSSVCSYANGYRNTISDGNYSYALGSNNSISVSNNSICLGRNNEIGNSGYSVSIGFSNKFTTLNGNSYKYAIGKHLSTLADGSMVCGSYNIAIPANPDEEENPGISNNDTMFTIGCGPTEDQRGNAFRVLRNGDTYANGAHNTSGADYAEFIEEWYDGNIDNEDRVGYMVTVKNGKLYKANEGDYIIGITSGNPSIVGNADEEYYWRYERDRFNRIMYEDVEIERSKVDGDICSINEMITIRRKKQSSAYDSTLQTSYIPRSKRPEWDYVGMRGIVPCRDDGTCEAGGFCKCGINGIATKAETRGFDTYYVLKRIDEETISVEVR